MDIAAQKTAVQKEFDELAKKLQEYQNAIPSVKTRLIELQGVMRYLTDLEKNGNKAKKE